MQVSQLTTYNYRTENRQQLLLRLHDMLSRFSKALSSMDRLEQIQWHSSVSNAEVGTTISATSESSSLSSIKAWHLLARRLCFSAQTLFSRQHGDIP